jgi:DNA uptake protein ComE-like DNA-binding protein
MSARPPAESGEAMGYTSRGTGWETRQSWFMLLFLTVALYWAPLVYMGLRVLEFRWVIYGLLYALPGALFALVTASSGGAGDAAGAGASLDYLGRTAGAFWFFALIHTWNARGEFLIRLAEQQYERDDLLERTQSRIDAVSSAGEPANLSCSRLAPRRLLDVNRVTEAEIAMLPGLGPEHARQAMQMREDMGDYRSFADFAAKLQLPPATSARLRPLFEPDSEEVALAIPNDDPAYRLLPDGSRVLEINWASAEALGALPGLGPEMARRAVTLRDGDGPYKSLEDFRYRLKLPMDVMIKIGPYVSVISTSPRPGGGGAPKTGGRIVDV